jgi:hypothetical protein
VILSLNRIWEKEDKISLHVAEARELFFKTMATLFLLNFLVEIQQISQPVKYPNSTETEEEEKAEKPLLALLSKVFPFQTSLVAIVEAVIHIMSVAVIDALYVIQNT